MDELLEEGLVEGEYEAEGEQQYEDIEIQIEESKHSLIPEVDEHIAALFPIYDPLDLAKLNKWFDKTSRTPDLLDMLAAVDENRIPPNYVTIEDIEGFFKLKLLHRRTFTCPSYGDLMKEMERLKIQTMNKIQFLQFLTKFIKLPDPEQEVLMAFQVFDRQNDGFIDMDEIRRILELPDDPFTEEEIVETVRAMSTTGYGTGNVHYDAFVRSMFRLTPSLKKLVVPYVYTNPDEDPSVPPEPEPEPEPELPPPPPPPPPPPTEKGKKGKGKK